MIKRYFPLYDDGFDEIHYLEVDKGSVFKVKDIQSEIVPVLKKCIKIINSNYVVKADHVYELQKNIEKLLEDFKC